RPDRRDRGSAGRTPGARASRCHGRAWHWMRVLCGLGGAPCGRPHDRRGGAGGPGVCGGAPAPSGPPPARAGPCRSSAQKAAPLLGCTEPEVSSNGFMSRAKGKTAFKSARRNHASSARARRVSHGLSVLEDIGAILSSSHDLQESLENIVRVVAERTSTEVCSLYIYEPRTHRLTLWATEGLNKASIGKVHMALDEGLTGLVLERLEPVMVVDALAHPRYKYFPETGEERYHSFLGVPVVERK